MSKITIEINIDNDSFGDRPEYELATILKHLSYKIDNGSILSDAATHPQNILDTQGNTVGNLTADLDD